jgi:hypothetical protein
MTLLAPFEEDALERWADHGGALVVCIDDAEDPTRASVIALRPGADPADSLLHWRKWVARHYDRVLTEVVVVRCEWRNTWVDVARAGIISEPATAT